MSCNSTKYPIM